MTRAWTLLRGIAALAALLAAVFGLPAALLAVGGSPIPNALPDLADFWDTLTSRDDGTVLFAALRVVAWAGWALFTLSVLADLVARVRRAPVPRLGPQQALASQLIAAVVAISVLTPATAPAAASPSATTSATQVTNGAPSWNRLTVRLDPADQAAHSTNQAVATTQPRAHRNHQTWHGYRVQAGDTLWDIADDHLGDPYRWPEIYAASLTVDQPDGHRLRHPDLIRPGWTMRIPLASTQAHEPLAEGVRPRQPVDQQQATKDAETLKTPFTGGVALPVGPSAPSTPFSASRGRAEHSGGVVAEDWRGRLRAAVPELD